MSTGPDQIDQHYLDAIADADQYPYWYEDADEPDSQSHAGAHRELRPVRRRRRLHRAVDGDHRQGARPVRDVVLIDAHEVGSAASGRNGGFMESSLTHGVGQRPWSASADEIEMLEELGLAQPDEIEAAIRRYAIDCDYERTGVIDVATHGPPTDRTSTSCATSSSSCARLGQQVVLLDAEAMHAEVALADLHRRAVAQGPRRARRPGAAGVGAEGGRRATRRADLRGHQGDRARAGRRRRARHDAARAGPGRARWRSAPTPSSRCCGG